MLILARGQNETNDGDVFDRYSDDEVEHDPGTQYSVVRANEGQGIKKVETETNR